MRFIGPKDAFFLYDKTRARWVIRLEIILVIILLFTVIGLIIEFAAGRIDKNKYKVKGSMTKIGQYRLLTNVSGQGKFTVVFDSDINTPMQQWAAIREQIDNEVKTFTYERAGYGWSDASPNEGDSNEAVKDLRTALKKSTAKAPYLLVGHGYGGLIMSSYAKQYPEDVIGVVLIDSLTEKEVTSKEFKRELDKKIITAGFIKNTSHIGGARLLDNLKILKVNEDLANNISKENLSLFRSLKVIPKQTTAVYKELEGLTEYKDSVQTDGALGDKSLIVFTSTERGENQEEKNNIINNQKELLKMSTKSEQVVVDDSSTFIHLEKADMIVSAIRTILKRNTK